MGAMFESINFRQHSVLRIFLCVHDFVCIRMIDLFVVATCLHVGFEQCGSDELVVFAGIHGCVNSG